jgi:mannose-1-phosphate guanylyltransferase / phosphomannomutase
MQAVIMAGGKGTRLRSITNDEIPKPMALIAGKPILQWQIESLKAEGVTDVILVVGYLGQIIEEFFGDGGDYGVRITYFHEDRPLGTAGAIGLLKDWLEQNYILVFGDVIFDVDLERMFRAHMEKGALATLFVHPNSHPFDSDLVLTEPNGRVCGIDSKSNTRNYWYHNQVNAGLYILSRSLCDRILSGVKSDLEKDVLLPLVASSGAVFAYRSPEYIKDVGTPERIFSAGKDLERGIVASRNLRHRQRCVFLDRDGTINIYRGLISREDEFDLEPHAAEAICALNSAGWLAIVVTNQPVVARGMCDIKDVDHIHAKMETLLGKEGAYLDDCAFCPHHPDKGYPEENPNYKIVCGCRKPKIGLITECAKKYNIDLARSWIVGDTTTDIQTGVNAGLHTALVLTGEAGKDSKYAVSPEFTADNILDAIKKIIESEDNQWNTKK